MQVPGSHGVDERGGAVTRILREVDVRVLDVLLALVLTAASIAILYARSGSVSRFRSEDALGILLVLIQTLPLAGRSMAPLAVLLAISASITAHSALGYAQVQSGTFSSLIALYSAAVLTDNRRGLIAAMISGSAVAAFFITNRGDWTPPVIASTSATWLVAWGAGTVARIRGEQVEVAGARVTRLELEQEARAREAVADERARMARELHDIVGHSLNLMVIQAAGARRVFDAKPEVTREALSSIEENGRHALDDMQRMLGVLRATDSEDVASAPQPGLAELENLAAHVREAGLAVDLAFEGGARELPASMDLSAYRIVQESLTNCLKHSGASHARVTVRYRPDDVEIEVVDDGRGAPASTVSRNGTGRGQLGMRERVALFGGEISFEVLQPHRGYRVRACLPLEATR